MSHAYSKAHKLDPTKGKRTKSVSAHETDVNLIVARFRKTGQIPAPLGKPIYADVSKTKDLREVMQAVQEIGSAKRKRLAQERREAAQRKAEEDAKKQTLIPGTPPPGPPPLNPTPVTESKENKVG